MFVDLDIKYAGFIEKEKRAVAKVAKMDAIKLDPNGLRPEKRSKPLTVGQAVCGRDS